MNKQNFPLSLIQNDIYFDQLQHRNSPLYNVGGVIRMGEVDLDRLRAAHRALIKGDDVYGLRIVSSGTLSQTISEKRTTKLPLLDFSDDPHPKIAANVWLKQRFETPIAFDYAELFRAAILKNLRTAEALRSPLVRFVIGTT